MAGKYDRKDHFYQKAKDEGFRSRASYKLLELDKKHAILKQGIAVLDLGAWPGGWLQIAAQKVGNRGHVVGIDLVAIDPLPQSNVVTICGDVRDQDNLKKAQNAIGQEHFDLILSDMAPKLSGIREVDEAAAVGCAELAVWVAEQLLCEGGALVAKVFKGNETEQFVKRSRPLFNKLIRVELDATRKTSSEYYVLGFNYKRPASTANTLA